MLIRIFLLILISSYAAPDCIKADADIVHDHVGILALARAELDAAKSSVSVISGALAAHIRSLPGGQQMLRDLLNANIV